MRLTKNTLYDISKHTNKTIKIADYLSKARHPILFNKMAMVNAQSSEIAFLEAFNSDMNETTKKLMDVHQLLSTVTNGKVLHLKGEQDLSVIFGNAYDSKNDTIDLPMLTLHLKSELSRDRLKELIVEKFLGLSISEYLILYKNRSKIFKHNKNELYTNQSRIEFLSGVADRIVYADVLTVIEEMSADYTVFRKQLTLEEKSLLDEKITFNKSMVDGVIKASTYISKEFGIVQIASSHKKQKEELALLFDELNSNKNLYAIELDPDTDLNAFLNLMVQIKETKFNLKEAVCLKSRKLGGYNANGLFFFSDNIVALDVKVPSAAIHELTHAVDLKNRGLNSNASREAFAQLMRSNLDLSHFKGAKRDYYNSTVEIIARAGEVAYLLEFYDFNPKKETFLDFESRVEIEQDKSNPYDLNLIKPIKEYTNRHSNVYFNIKQMPPSDLILMRNYFKSYFRITSDLNIEDTVEFPLPKRKKHVVVGIRKNYVSQSVNLINLANIIPMLEYNEKNKIIETDLLIKQIMYNPLSLNRTTKSLSNEQVCEKAVIISKMCEWAQKTDKFYIMSRIIEARIHADSTINVSPAIMSSLMLKNDFFLSGNSNDRFEDFNNGVKDLLEQESKLKFNDYGLRMELNQKYVDVAKNTSGALAVNFENFLQKDPRYAELKIIKSNASSYADGKFHKLSSFGLTRIYGSVDLMLNKSIDKSGGKIFNYFNGDDLFPMSTLGMLNKKNKQFYLSSKENNSLALEYKTNKKSILIGLIDKTGNLKKLTETIGNIDFTSDSFIVKGTMQGGIGFHERLCRSFNSEIRNINATQDQISLYNMVFSNFSNRYESKLSSEEFRIQDKQIFSNYSSLIEKCNSEIPKGTFDNYEKIQNEIKSHIESFYTKQTKKTEVLVDKIEKNDVKIKKENDVQLKELIDTRKEATLVKRSDSGQMRLF